MIVMNRLKRHLLKFNITIRGYVFLSRILRKQNYLDAVAAIKTFVPKNMRADKKTINRTLNEVMSCCVKYSMIPKEYYLFDFKDRDEEDRHSFIGYSERSRINAIAPREIKQIFWYKDKTYQMFHEYYRRDVLLIENEEQRTQFMEFIKKHSEFVAKPVKGLQGQGVKKINADGIQMKADEAFSLALQLSPCFIEELIVQNESMMRFHRESVNTVRLVTWCENNKMEPIFALLRVGCGKSFVDNAGAGGILAAIDLETGKIITAGYRQNGKVYERHPDTGICFEGEVIEEWSDLLRIAGEAAGLVPEQKIIGWDFALGRNGWVLIEANQSPSFTGIQMSTQKGLRPRLKEITSLNV